MAGRLYLVPNLLGVVEPASVLPVRTIDVARRLRYFVVENAKPARQFLKTLGPATPLQELHIAEIGEAPSPSQSTQLLAPLRSGQDVGMLSDAGCPGVADPGAVLVAAAHRERLVVTPLVGPSAVLLALMASGMNGQGFTFNGYLPAKPAPRNDAIVRLETSSRQTGYAQLFIETPYRNVALLEALCAACRDNTRLCVAVDLTTDIESVETRSVGEWRGESFARYAKRPAMFVLQA
jgi:16S rRNA (cytidine1402-2'-O)-methyltransferase